MLRTYSRESHFHDFAFASCPTQPLCPSQMSFYAELPLDGHTPLHRRCKLWKDGRRTGANPHRRVIQGTTTALGTARASLRMATRHHEARPVRESAPLPVMEHQRCSPEDDFSSTGMPSLWRGMPRRFYEQLAACFVMQWTSLPKLQEPKPHLPSEFL